MIRQTALAALLTLSLLHLSAQDGEKAMSLFNEQSYDSALYYVDRAIVNEPDELPSLLKLKADIISYLNDMTGSIEYYKKALLAIESAEIKDLTLVTECYGGLAFCYGYLGLFEKAVSYSHIHLNHALRIENSQEIATAYFNLSSYSTRLARYDSAIYFIGKAYEIDVASGDSSAMSSDLNTLGFLYGQLGDFEKAFSYHKQSLALLKPHHKNQLASRYNNMGMMLMEQGKYSDAEAHMIRSIELHRELNDSLKMAQRRQNLATLYNRMKLYPKALVYVTESIGYYERTGNSYFEANARLQLAETLEKQNNVAGAITEVKKAVDLALGSGNLVTVVGSYKKLVQLYDSQGRKSQAYEALKNQKLFEDSVQGRERVAAINDMELKFMTEQKEKEIELLEVSNRLTEANLDNERRTTLLLSVVILILLAAAFAMIITQKQKFRLKEDLLSQEADNLRLQINALIGAGDQKIQVALDDVNEKLKERLSEREFDILKLAITEKSNREIAEEIYVSVNTVKFHLKNIYEKLGVSNRKEALQFVIRE